MEHDRRTGTPPEKDAENARVPKGEEKDDDLEQDDQSGTAEPQDGVGQYQGGGIEDAIGGGTSGQGGG